MRFLSHFIEFGVRRNLRVLNAKLRGVSHSGLQHIMSAMGKQFEYGPQTSVYGTKFAANFHDKTFRYCLYGTYGKRFSDYLTARSEPFVFLDIGANQGLFTMVAALNPNCLHAIALEPVKRTFDFLTINARLNEVMEKATLLNAALSNKTGLAEIAVKSNHSGVASLQREPLQSGGLTEQITLMDATSLDEYIPEGVDIIVKVDVEGHEAVVISELLKSKHARRMVTIFHEMDERWAEADPIRECLTKAGFSSFKKFGIGRHYDILAERAA
ncbi:MAG: FkbM family methyltransferase [Pseudomonadota bacterium]